MTIKVTNYRTGEILKVSLPLLVGEVTVTGDSEISVHNITADSTVIWPVINGKFKALVPLKIGENKIKLEHKHNFIEINLTYDSLKFKRFVRLVYIKCIDDDGIFQAPEEENNSIGSACKRICLGAQMLQTFTSDKLKEHNLNKKTFRLEEDNGRVVCHVFTSSMHLHEAFNLNQEQLWAHFAVELMNSNLRVGNDCKFLAFLSFTRYKNDSTDPPRNYHEILQMTKGQVALGGGGLALFGSGCLHTWPENLQEVPWRFGDNRRVDRMKFMDDSANRGRYWACYSTGLGATLHELGHTFDLGHTTGGIMGRGFDDIYKYFIIDMFYYDHLFQKQYNPFYQESSIHNHFVSISVTSPVSCDDSIHKLKNLHLKPASDVPVSQARNNNQTSTNLNETPWRIPNPPEFAEDGSFAVGVGGAYWTRSCALILHYHKWFNDIDNPEKNKICLENDKISSPHGIRVVEFRDLNGTSFHHLEFSEDAGCPLVDFSLCGISKYIPEGLTEISFVAEDNVGNILKSKLDLKGLLKESA